MNTIFFFTPYIYIYQSTSIVYPLIFNSCSGQKHLLCQHSFRQSNNECYWSLLHDVLCLLFDVVRHSNDKKLHVYQVHSNFFHGNFCTINTVQYAAGHYPNDGYLKITQKHIQLCIDFIRFIV